MKKLVSILSVTWNGAEFLDYFLRSILAQTYERIEFIITDDGSTDSTAEKLRSYEPLFAERGYTCRVLRIEHSGAAAALNAGLECFTGDFLMWIDSDDKLEPDAVEKLTAFLSAHEEYGFAVCDARYLNYGSNEEGTVFGRQLKGTEDPYFRDLLSGSGNYSLGCGTALVRREAFETAIPSRQIFVSPEGQNLQIMLPLTHCFRCGYLHEPLFIRVMRKDSHSHKQRTYDEDVTRQRNFITLMEETVRRIPMPEEEQREAFDLIEARFARRILNLAYRNGDRTEARKQARKLRSLGALTRIDSMKALITGAPLLCRAAGALGAANKRLRRKLK